jgi:hypothetical protein
LKQEGDDRAALAKQQLRSTNCLSLSRRRQNRIHAAFSFAKDGKAQTIYALSKAFEGIAC